MQIVQIVLCTIKLMYLGKRGKTYSGVSPEGVFPAYRSLAFCIFGVVGVYESDIFFRLIALLFAVKRGCLSRGTEN